MIKGRRHGEALASLSYFAIAFAVTALLQGAVKWQYSLWYGYDTTWNAVETFYWAITINVVYIWQMLRKTADARGESSRGNDRKHSLIYAVIADVAAAIAVVWKSYHIRWILHCRK
ncbi:MAG: hypothetical protein LUE14_10360 [Clostridiales bacterium]|nr:hypothetical protein [Clostridiales bacterium]